MALKLLCSILFVSVILSNVAAKSVNKESEGCNAFSGWQTCLGKRGAEEKNGEELSTIDEKMEIQREVENLAEMDSDAYRNEATNSRANKKKRRLFDAFMRYLNEEYRK